MQSKFISFIFLLFISFCSVQAQGTKQTSSQLANKYFQQGEYEKAAAEYKKLYQVRKNDYYFKRYVEAVIALEDYEQAGKIINDAIRTRPNDVHLLVSLGYMYEQQFEEEKAIDQYERAIKNMPTDLNIISQLGNAFLSLAKYDYAIRVYEKGEDIIGGNYNFSSSLAELYKRKGDSPRMLYYYLNTAEQNPKRINNLKINLQRNLQKEDYAVLQSQLYERIQEEPDIIEYQELLVWAFMQDKNYAKAFRQARALDRKLEENGMRVYSIANIARQDKDFETAIDAYNYIIENKGVNSSYYIDAKRELLNSRKEIITADLKYEKEDLMALKMEYDTFLNEFGENRQTSLVMREYADFQALYLNDIDEAIKILTKVKDMNGISKNLRAKAKVSLADYYLIDGEIWESTLLYSQVDKDFKEEFIGELARFKNAKLSYYNGDFGWAQAQFDILKASTSKLISNDAIDLSVFIMDNMGLDTTDAPLMLYANADLLIYQNRFDEAFAKLDSISTIYPEHSLQDDLLYSKAQINVKQKNFDEAIKFYNQIIEKHVEEIRCDNAIYELAKLYDYQLVDKEKAQELYQKLFIDFSNSTLAVDARKRYRVLRGDDIQ